ncbi:MAG: FAD-binding oxidoreductase [Candidatus Thorarchaeota archaeon]
MITRKELQELADIVGEDYFSAESFMKELYSSDIAALPGLVNDLLQTRADAIAQPITSEIVSNVLKYCSSKGIPVIPRGHGTSGYGGALPTRNGLVLEMTRMNQIYNIDRENMTVEVGAGIIWGTLLEALEDEGLSLAAYPSSAPSSTVGGWVAAGGTGIGSTKYGGISNQIVDLEVVLPNGMIIRTKDGGKHLAQALRKPDYTYYPGSEKYLFAPPDFNEFEDDVSHLFVDSNGTLGVVTKVVLKLIPLQNIRPMVASFRSRRLMINALKDILEATRPFYLHFITNEFFRMMKEVGKAPATAGDWVILSTYEGSEDEVSAEVEKFHHFVKRHNGVIESDELAHHEWGERFYPLRIKRLGPSLAPSEVYVPLDNLQDFLTDIDDHFKDEKYAIEGAITINGEVAALAWFLDDERKKISFLMGWYRSLDFIDIGIKNGGRAYSIGLWNVPHSRSYYGRERLGKMSDLKRYTDPKRSVNPNKVFSGSLNLSLRFNLLIMFAVSIALPIILVLAGLWFPSIINYYVPWIVPVTVFDFIIAFWAGMCLGYVLVEIVNVIPVGFVLSIGGPFMRLFRRIWH